MSLEKMLGQAYREKRERQSRLEYLKVISIKDRISYICKPEPTDNSKSNIVTTKSRKSNVRVKSIRSRGGRRKNIRKK